MWSGRPVIGKEVGDETLLRGWGGEERNSRLRLDRRASSGLRGVTIIPRTKVTKKGVPGREGGSVIKTSEGWCLAVLG